MLLFMTLSGGKLNRNSFLLPVTMWTRNYNVRAYLGQNPTETPKYLLAFSVSVPPLGFGTYTISSAKNVKSILKVMI